MRHLKYSAGIILTLVFFIFFLLLPGCAEDKNKATIRIGSKNFTEQFILAEIMAQMIENRTTLNVERIFNLGGTMICHNALVNGEIDLYAEYTGTGLTAIMKQEVVTDPDHAYQSVSKHYLKNYQIKWLQPFGFNNTYALTLRGSNAREYGWTKISDLVSAGTRLKAGFTAEFTERPDGYPGLKESYGLAFQSVKDMDPALMYRAIAEKEVDVICAFSTDGRIKAYDLLPLEDDRHFFPPYSAAPVIRHSTSQRYPEVVEALNQLAGVIDNRIMQQLNYMVDETKEPPEAVAHKFLLGKKLIKSP